MTITELTKDNFEKETKDKCIVDFWASWCGPCMMMKPIFHELSEELDIKFCSVDTEQNPELSEQFDIRGIPCFIVFKDGKEADRIVGARDKDTFKGEIENA